MLPYSTRFVFLDPQGIFGIDIPHNVVAHGLPKVVPLWMDACKSNFGHPYLGYGFGITEDIEGAFTVLYEWPDELKEQQKPYCLYRHFRRRCYGHRPYMDEGSGRVVITSNDFRVHLVLDFAV